VLTTLVGAILLRIASGWDGEDGSAQTGTSGPVVNCSTTCILDLILDTCWSQNPTLRRFQIDILVELVENETWHVLEVESSCTDIVGWALALLEHPQTREPECCKILGVISHVLRTRSFVSSPQHSHRPRSVKPFSRREKPEEPRKDFFLELAALAFPLVLATLENKSENVRLKATETLGDFLPLLQPDSLDEKLTEDGSIVSEAHKQFNAIPLLQQDDPSVRNIRGEVCHALYPLGVDEGERWYATTASGLLRPEGVFFSSSKVSHNLWFYEPRVRWKPLHPRHRRLTKRMQTLPPVCNAWSSLVQDFSEFRFIQVSASVDIRIDRAFWGRGNAVRLNRQGRSTRNSAVVTQISMRRKDTARTLQRRIFRNIAYTLPEERANGGCSPRLPPKHRDALTTQDKVFVERVRQPRMTEDTNRNHSRENLRDLTSSLLILWLNLCTGSFGWCSGTLRLWARE